MSFPFENPVAPHHGRPSWSYDQRRINMQASHNDAQDRVVLLLDLDAFYAQCECLRLGWEASKTPLALLQWNSVLAVTYPARDLFGIKRGDSWDAVHQKSKGKCHAVHVQILRTEIPTNDEQQSLNAAQETKLFDNDYDSIYCLNEEQRQRERQDCLGVRHFHNQGKACIERYRVASARIFATVVDWIRDRNDSNSIVLERASIDEFFLDVTAACTSHDDASCHDEENSGSFPQQTVIIEADDSPDDDGNRRNNPETKDNQDYTVRALKKGSLIAWQIRQHIYKTLGFTLTAGIAVNKTLAKLSASYGKPNGQAVLFPQQMPRLLSKTLISKTRNLGGKLGAKVQALLLTRAPHLASSGTPATLGSIQRYLSLGDLKEGLGSVETAMWVANIARGVDEEPVIAKNISASSSHLIKSITAFKSLAKPYSLEEAGPWIRLLANEIVCRVEKDTLLNSRYPKTCNIVYHRHTGTFQKGRHARNTSVRTPFPAERLSTAEKVQELINTFPNAIQNKEGRVFIQISRLGLCAVDFCSRASSDSSIRAFFPQPQSQPTQNSAGNKSAEEMPRLSPKKRSLESIKPSRDPDQEYAKRLQKMYDGEQRILSVVDASKKTWQGHEGQMTGAKTNLVMESDLAIAKRLQAKYDREDALFERAGCSRQPMKGRIESFFAKKSSR